MRQKRVRLGVVSVVAFASLFLLISVATTNSDVRVGLPGSHLALRLGASAGDRVSPEFRIHGSIHFRLNNRAELDRLLEEQQDPHSDNYRRWLTPQEFGRRFGARPEAYKAALDWLQASGIRPARVWANRLGVEFDGRADQVERAFGVRMRTFELEGRTYYANEDAPQIPAGFAAEVESVRLHNLRRLHPLAIRPGYNVAPDFNSAGRVAIGPKDFYFIYNLNPIFAEGVDGAGQTIGIVASSDFNISDVDKYRQTFNLPPGDVVKIPASSQVTNLGGVDEAEALLDVQLAGMAAPQAKIQVVIADKADDIDQSLALFVNNFPDTKVINISFGGCERELGPTFQSVFDNLYKEAAAQGQTILVSSGDTGANDCRDGSGRQVNGLASSPFVTGVGGTSLSVTFGSDGNVSAYLGERVWSGSGGGMSAVYTRPAYQLGAGIPEGRTRAVPDVALLADPSLSFFYVQSGALRIIGGTSVSAPPWAGIFALINQFAKTSGVGLANPRIYQLGLAQQQGGQAVFHDITEGSNTDLGVEGFPALIGYDMSTGWGSPNADLFIRNFASITDSASGLLLLEPNGGEFLDADKTISVRWRISDALAPQVASQDVLLSTDGGQSFQPITTKLGSDARSFDFTPSGLVTTTARFRIVVHTTAGADLVDSSDTDLNIGTKLRIELAQYSSSSKKLQLMGEGFTKRARVIVNGIKSKRKPKLPAGDTLVFPGTTEKLNLKSGGNQIILEIDGVRSAPFILML